MAATDRTLVPSRLFRRLAALLGGVFAAFGAHAVDLPEDRAELMYHSYTGGGVTRQRPGAAGAQERQRQGLAAGLVLRRLGQQRVDRRRDDREPVPRAAHRIRARPPTTCTAIRRSRCRPRAARSPTTPRTAFSLDVSQESFGGMTTTSLGFTRGADTVGKKNSPEFFRLREALAVPRRPHADPDADLDRERELRGDRRRRLPAAARTASRACSAPRCPNATRARARRAR